MKEKITDAVEMLLVLVVSATLSAGGCMKAHLGGTCGREAIAAKQAP